MNKRKGSFPGKAALSCSCSVPACPWRARHSTLLLPERACQPRPVSFVAVATLAKRQWRFLAAAAPKKPRGRPQRVTTHRPRALVVRWSIISATVHAADLLSGC